MLTSQERAQAVVMAWYRGPYTLHHDPADEGIAIEIRDVAAAIDAAVAEERKRLATIASHVFLNDPYALHPDIAFDDMNESARMAAHSIAQTISTLISHGVTKASELPN